MPNTELAVGDPARRRAVVAVVAALGLAAVFATVTIVSKETPALNVAQPWQDDPYDVPVSLDFAALPLLVAIGGLRVQLCRHFETLPVRRLVDLLRVASAVLWVSLATELVEWIAVALGRRRATWNAATTGQVVALAVLTAATVGAGVLVRRSTRVVTRTAVPAAQPDWLADGVALGLYATRILGRHQGRARTFVRRVDAQVIARVRAHPLAAAGLLAVALGLPFVVAKVVLEGYPAPLVAIIFALVTASFFVLVVVIGAYLRLVAPRNARPPGWLHPVSAACVAGSVAFAFHDALLAEQTIAGLGRLFFGAALTGGLASAVAQAIWRRRLPRPVPAAVVSGRAASRRGSRGGRG